MLTDPLTKQEFYPKRISQRFATPQNRIKYHNDKAKKLRHSSAYINKPLHINHRILIELLEGKKEAVFHKQFLIGKGFSFSVNTHIEDYNGKKRYAIYEFVIISLENEQIQIIKIK